MNKLTNRTIYLFAYVVVTNLCSIGQTVQANTNASNPQKLFQQAIEKNLAADPFWISLLHHRKKNVFSDEQGTVLTNNFYLSENGRTDATAELKATLEALTAPVGKDPNKHAQCKFPARYIWLKKSLNWTLATPSSPRCTDYSLWTHSESIDSVSLIYVSGYLQNPASFYGHILLKLNTKRSVNSSSLLDLSLDYGAIIPDEDGIIPYILKGLSGGYEAGFTHNKFYKKNHNYGEINLRDLWEYELTLTPHDLELLIAHSWEVLGKKFTYYYIRENCAFAMAELLELVVKKQLYPRKTPWVIPSSIINRINNVKYNGGALVGTVQHHPSRQRRFAGKFKFLDSQLKYFITHYVKGDKDINSRMYKEFSTKQKIMATETLLDYYQFLEVGKKQNESLKIEIQKLLVERFHLPGIQIAWPKKNPTPPHDAQQPTLLQVSYFDNEYLGSGYELRFRAAYSDFLSLDGARMPYSKLAMLDLSMVFSNGNTRLKQLDLLHIENFNVSKTGIKRDGGLAWKLKAGYEQYDLACKNCLVFNVEGGIGKAVELTEGTAIFGMIDARIQEAYKQSSLIALTPRIGLISTLTNSWRMYLSLGYREFIEKQGNDRVIIRWENRFGSNKNWDARISFERNNTSEAKVSIAYHW